MGKVYAPAFSPDFPAKRIDTGMHWDDAVLHPTTQLYIDDIKMGSNTTIAWNRIRRSREN